MQQLKELRPDESVPAWAFRFLQSVPGVTMILSGMSSLQQVQDNVATFAEDRPLNRQEFDTIVSIADNMVKSGVLPCTACHYCTSHCPMQLDIPRLLALYNEHAFTRRRVPGAHGGGSPARQQKALGLHRLPQLRGRLPAADQDLGSHGRLLPQAGAEITQTTQSAAARKQPGRRRCSVSRNSTRCKRGNSRERLRLTRLFPLLEYPGCGARIMRRALDGACILRPLPLLRLAASAAGGARLRSPSTKFYGKLRTRHFVPRTQFCHKISLSVSPPSAHVRPQARFGGQPGRKARLLGRRLSADGDEFVFSTI